MGPLGRASLLECGGRDRCVYCDHRGVDYGVGPRPGIATCARRPFSTVCTDPANHSFCQSPALVGVSFRFMFNAEFGLFDAFFGWLVPLLANVNWLANPALAFAVCVMADVWGWIPFLTLVLVGGLASVPRESQEAAQIDGASGWQVFRDVTLPLLRPVLAVVVILKSIFSLKTFDQVYMLTNGGPGTATQTLSHYVYFNGFKYGEIGYSAAVAWMMVIPMIFLTYAYAKLVFKKG